MISTFTVAVGGDADESDAAAVVAHHLGTDHTTIPLPDVDPVVMSERVARHFDEPFADASALPTLRVCELARETVTVALSGDGADEAFAGYRRHRFHAAEERARAVLPQSVRSSVFGALGRATGIDVDAMERDIARREALDKRSDSGTDGPND